MTDRYDAYVDDLAENALQQGWDEPEPTDDDRPWLPYPEYAQREYERLVIAEVEREGSEAT